MIGWVVLTASEFAYLSNVDQDSENLFDRLTVAGDWLRDPISRALGEQSVGERMSSSESVSAEAWVLLSAAAHELAKSPAGSVLRVRGERGTAVIFTASGVQVAFVAGTIALRLAERAWSLDELGQALACVGRATEATVIKSSPDLAITCAHWSAETPSRSTGAPSPVGADSIEDALTFALDGS